MTDANKSISELFSCLYASDEEMDIDQETKPEKEQPPDHHITYDF